LFPAFFKRVQDFINQCSGYTLIRGIQDYHMPAGDYKEKYLQSKDKFDRIFQLTSAASKIINSDLTILKVNKALTELLGFSADEIEGTEILDYACEEYKPHWHELQEALWSKQVPFFKIDVCLIKKDKSLAWVHITTILFDDDEETYGFTVLDEYTWRRSYEETQKRLNMALQYSKVAVWEMNLEDKTVVRSKDHDQLFGYSEPLETWTEEHYWKHILPEDLPKLQEEFRHIGNDTIIDFQCRIQTVAGLVRWMHFQGRADTNSYGIPVKILGTVNDITKEKLAERHREDFISIASHELKTPLTGLKASLQLLNRMKDHPTEKLSGLLEQANKSMIKINALVDDLLNASKVNEHQLHLKKTRVNLFKLVEDCCQHVRIAGVYKLETTGDKYLEVNADAERIDRVIVNFINNAIKYAPESKHILMHVERVDNNVKVSVSDKGQGISPDIVPHLFNRYYQADNTGNQYSGLGLGLYISSEIIKKHGGNIGVDTETGNGSTFWFTLPFGNQL
jgi:PAS domain S-box-containing protein